MPALHPGQVKAPDYLAFRVGAARTLVSDRASDWIRDVLADRTLYEWARDVPGMEPLGGRAVARAVPDPLRDPPSTARWVVRHYTRGGWMAPLLGDRYPRAGPTRPEREIVASTEAHRKGIRTPKIIAAAWYRTGLFYRADLVTELVPGARTLAEVLAGEARGETRRAALFAAGRLARKLGAVGLRHADLNATNVLLAGPPPFEAFVIDLDRARIGTGPTRRGADSMLRRLERSARTLGEATGRPPSDEELHALRAGSGDTP